MDGRFFVLEYPKSYFPNLNCLKRKVGKMANFQPKPWVNPFGKISITLTFWTFCFYSRERRFFVLEYHKKHFPNEYCLKKKVGKIAILEPKPWVNPFRKKSIFKKFWTSCFHSLERHFSVLEYRKRHFPNQHWRKKNVGKMAILGPKPWVNPFGKMSIFRILELFVFIA